MRWVAVGGFVSPRRQSMGRKLLRVQITLSGVVGNEEYEVYSKWIGSTLNGQRSGGGGV